MKRKLLLTSLLIFVFGFNNLINAKIQVNKENLSQRGGYIVCPDGKIHMASWDSFEDLDAIIDALCNR